MYEAVRVLPQLLNVCLIAQCQAQKPDLSFVTVNFIDQPHVPHSVSPKALIASPQVVYPAGTVLLEGPALHASKTSSQLR